MFNRLLSKIIGNPNKRILDKLQLTVDEVNELEEEFVSLTNQQLKDYTITLKSRISDGEELDDILPEAFAAVRESAKRTIGMRHYDVQIIGGIVLHQGQIAEMRTGEGKTLVATLPAYLNALSGNPVHIITVNDYLARRDASWMGAVYEQLGLSVSCMQSAGSLMYQPYSYNSNATKNGKDIVTNDASTSFIGIAGENMHPCDKKQAYQCDIIYGTNQEFGFDYLRDNITPVLENRVCKKDISTAFGIVDEVDNVLIDEARTPLIISGESDTSTTEYAKYAHIAKQLEEDIDFEIDKKRRNVIITEEGVERLEQILNIDNLYAPDNVSTSHFIENALRAAVIYNRDVEYVVKDGEILLVDEFTGRLMQGRRLGHGMHQALEAKEGISIRKETKTYATITIQNLFRSYNKLAGMTGTAATESEEFDRIYKLGIVQIPTNKPDIRKDLPSKIYLTEEAKWRAVQQYVIELHNKRVPVLIGTNSIDKSENLSNMLRKKRIPVQILNAKHHEQEAAIIAQAGRPGAVTVSTSMAGRGTDIILGGNPQALGISEEQWQADHEEVTNNQGLFVIGTELHDSRRIDNQLRGRAARQGDPGNTLFFISAEDEIVRRFGADRIKSVMRMLNWNNDDPIENNMLSKAIESTQVKVESYNFEIRQNLVKYDDILNVQRKTVYSLRKKIQEAEDVQKLALDYVQKEITTICQQTIQGRREQWNLPLMRQDLGRIFHTFTQISQIQDNTTHELKDIQDKLVEYAQGLYTERKEKFSKDIIDKMARYLLLNTIDQSWVEHLSIVEGVREGIGLQAVGQRDPLVQYQRIAFEMFNDMLNRVQTNFVQRLFNYVPANVNPNRQAPIGRPNVRNNSISSNKTSVKRKQIGRNQACYCGSGKKYKRCHGKVA